MEGTESPLNLFTDKLSHQGLKLGLEAIFKSHIRFQTNYWNQHHSTEVTCVIALADLH